MGKVDELVAKQIGEMSLTIIKQRATIEALSAQMQAQAVEIEKLKATRDEPQLPIEKGNGDARAH